MKTLRDLKTLLKETRRDIEPYFRELHHFAKHPPFKTKPPQFAAFVEYCETRRNGIKEDGENERTIQRAYEFITLMQTLPPDECLAKSWNTHPLAKVCS